MARKLTQEDVLKIFNELYNGEYELLSEYKLSTKPITIRHKLCGNTYDVSRAKTFLKEGGGKCPICYPPMIHSTKKLTEDEIINRIKNQTNGEYSYISGFVNSNTKMKVKHNLCGTIYEVTPHMMLGSKQRRCPKCGNDNRGKYALKENYLQTLLDDKEYGNEYKWMEEYKNDNKELHRIHHLLCDHQYNVRPNDFQQGYRCPYCSSSKEQKEVYEFIKSIYSGQVIYNYKKYGKEIDIYIPDLNLGVEYNGSYWHCDKNQKDINYHLNKLNLFKEKDIRIFFIESYQWKHKKGIIKNKLRNLLMDENHYFKNIYARNTKVKFNLSIDKKRNFLNKFHIQGYCHDTFNFYLVYNKTIVALMTFGFNRKNVNGSGIELLRYVTHGRYHVVGGFSRLLKHSVDYIKENYPNIDYITTYADRSMSEGNVYYKNGFVLDHISKPSYYYTDRLTNSYINRYKYRKSELKKLFPDFYDDNLSEFEIINKIDNIFRIWNCGNLVFRYYINRN